MVRGGDGDEEKRWQERTGGKQEGGKKGVGGPCCLIDKMRNPICTLCLH